ncbi:MAG: rod shape-determining protein MreD [Shimia sp.]|uniref:rod shape-determining protein MreD n=1 Tax=Shimia sp. TaxID=1954381 RepID=UPI00405899A9
MLVLCLAWAARQPVFTPPLLVAALFLLADFLFLRPPGIGALAVVLAVEVQRKRAPTLRDATFLTEWATAAALIVLIALGLRVVLMVFFLDRPSLGLTLIQVMMNIAVYPFVVLVSQVVFGVRRQAVRDGNLGAA